MLNVHSALDRTQIQFDYIDMYGGIAFAKQIEELGGKIYSVPFFKKHPIKNLLRLRDIIKQGKYNIVHINMLSAANILPFLAAKMAGAKLIIAHSHNANTDKNLLRIIMHFLNKPFLPLFVDKAFYCSKKAGYWLFTKKLFKNAVFIKNGIDVDKFAFNAATREEYRKKFGLADKTIYIHIGRFSEQKNHIFLTDIFAQILKQQKNAVLLLAGEGPLKADIERETKQKSLQDSVKFLGTREDIPALLNAADVFILPSLYEGLPIVGVEAQASGLPCFFSDAITEELNIVNSKFISLQKNAMEWADDILAVAKGFKWQDSGEAVKKAGFDIKDTAWELTEWYKKIKK